MTDKNDGGKRTSVYLSTDQQRAMARLGVTVAEVVRAGLAALESTGTGPLVVSLASDGTYTIRRERPAPREQGTEEP